MQLMMHCWSVDNLNLLKGRGAMREAVTLDLTLTSKTLLITCEEEEVLEKTAVSFGDQERQATAAHI